MPPGNLRLGPALHRSIVANHLWVDCVKDYFGAFFLRMRARLGTAQAITATAHKLARVVYHVLHSKEPYTETVFQRCDEQEQQRAEMRLRKHAAQLDFQLLPISTNPAASQISS